MDTASKEMINVRYQLRKLRTEKGLSVENIASLAGISVSHYYKIEQGRRNPTISVAIKIANCLGSTIDDVFFNSELDNSSRGAQNNA